MYSDQPVLRPDCPPLYQLTHIAREQKCIIHDGRIDAVAGGVAYFMASMAMRDRIRRQAADQEGNP